jgi:hypothetical protein
MSFVLFPANTNLQSLLASSPVGDIINVSGGLYTPDSSTLEIDADSVYVSAPTGGAIQLQPGFYRLTLSGQFRPPVAGDILILDSWPNNPATSQMSGSGNVSAPFEQRAIAAAVTDYTNFSWTWYVKCTNPDSVQINLSAPNGTQLVIGNLTVDKTA